MKFKIIILVGLACLIVIFLKLSVHKNDNTTPVVSILPLTSQAPTKITLNGVSRPAPQFPHDEWSALTNAFNERMKPAIDKWANVYAGRLPFDASEITLDKFHSRLAGGFYTFMIGDTTFTVLDNRNGTKVFYMMTKSGAKDLNSIPAGGSTPDLTVPITREQVLKMAEADTGLKYALKDIDIKPTAAACSIQGGAFVEVGIEHKNGMVIAAINNLSFVIGADGKLVTYQH